MKRWLARRLQGLVWRLARPITEQVLARIDAAARDSRDLHATTVGRIDALERELVETASRDLGVLVRMLAAAEARADALRTRLPAEAGNAGRHSPGAVAACTSIRRYAIVLGAQPGSGDQAATALLRALRPGLDRIDDVADGSPEIWIEHHRPLGDADGCMTLESYNRALKSGTGFIEALTPADVVAIGQALDHNGRSDVRLVFRCLGADVPEAERDVFRQAFQRSDHWIFTSQTICDAVQAACGLSAEMRDRIHVHPMPDPAATDPATLARTYRASVVAVLRSLHIQADRTDG